MIKVIDLKIKDVKIIKPKIYYDDRGNFFESFNLKSFNFHNPKFPFIQDNQSESSFGVLRGIHFQKQPYAQTKLVRVIFGEIQDIAVDLRPDSSTYLEYISIILNDKNNKQLYVPKGFGHAFLTLSKKAIVSYKVDNFYNQNFDLGINYNDPILNIDWELDSKDIILSEKDNLLPNLNISKNEK